MCKYQYGKTEIATVQHWISLLETALEGFRQKVNKHRPCCLFQETNDITYICMKSDSNSLLNLSPESGEDRERN